MEGKIREKSRELVVKAIDGDTEAFKELYRIHANMILYQTRRFIDDPGQAEDAAAKAVIEVYKNIRSLSNPDAFVPWLYRLTKYVSLKHLRDESKIKHGQTAVTVDEIAENVPDGRVEYDPEKAAEEKERNSAVMSAIDALPEKQREALILYYYEDLTYKEIAAAIGSNVSTVSTNIMKAKKNIAKNLDSVLAVAITADATGKLADIDISSFFAKCDSTISNTPAGKASAKSVTQGATQILPVAAMTAGAVAAAIAIVSIGAAGFSQNTPAAVLPGPEMQPPASETPVVAALPEGESVEETAPEAVILAEIVFAGNDCECGHVNPTEASVDIITDGVAGSWEIVGPDGGTVSSGEGGFAPIHPGELPSGTYTVNFVISNDAGTQVTASRDFLITTNFSENIIYL